MTQRERERREIIVNSNESQKRRERPVCKTYSFVTSSLKGGVGVGVELLNVASSGIVDEPGLPVVDEGSVKNVEALSGAPHRNGGNVDVSAVDQYVNSLLESELEVGIHVQQVWNDLVVVGVTRVVRVLSHIPPLSLSLLSYVVFNLIGALSPLGRVGANGSLQGGDW